MKRNKGNIVLNTVRLGFISLLLATSVYADGPTVNSSGHTDITPDQTHNGKKEYNIKEGLDVSQFKNLKYLGKTLPSSLLADKDAAKNSITQEQAHQLKEDKQKSDKTKPGEEKNNEKNGTIALPGNMKDIIHPLEKLIVTSNFGPRRHPVTGRQGIVHTGLDLAAANGVPIKAVQDGKVTVAGEKGTYGNAVFIDHGNGYSTAYGHMSVVKTTVGAQVKKGDVIGLVGTTGRSTGPHLHFEVRINNKVVDPKPYLKIQ